MSMFVHCRYRHQHSDEGLDAGDGWVWICVAAIGPVEAPVEDVDGYHTAPPPGRCSCGYDPFPPAPQDDGHGHPAGHP